MRCHRRRGQGLAHRFAGHPAHRRLRCVCACVKPGLLLQDGPVLRRTAPQLTRAARPLNPLPPAAPGCGRFALAARLLGRERRAALAELLSEIEGGDHGSGTQLAASGLRAAYGC